MSDRDLLNTVLTEVKALREDSHENKASIEKISEFLTGSELDPEGGLVDKFKVLDEKVEAVKQDVEHINKTINNVRAKGSFLKWIAALAIGIVEFISHYAEIVKFLKHK